MGFGDYVFRRGGANECFVLHHDNACTSLVVCEIHFPACRRSDQFLFVERQGSRNDPEADANIRQPADGRRPRRIKPTLPDGELRTHEFSFNGWHFKSVLVPRPELLDRTSCAHGVSVHIVVLCTNSLTLTWVILTVRYGWGALRLTETWRGILGIGLENAGNGVCCSDHSVGPYVPCSQRSYWNCRGPPGRWVVL